MADDLVARIRRRVHKSSSERSSVAICPGGNGERPSLSSSMPIEAELTSLIVPSARCRRARAQRIGDQLVQRAVLADQVMRTDLATLLRVRKVSRLCCTESCSVWWITMRMGWRALWFDEGTHLRHRVARRDARKRRAKGPAAKEPGTGAGDGACPIAAAAGRYCKPCARDNDNDGSGRGIGSVVTSTSAIARPPYPQERIGRNTAGPAGPAAHCSLHQDS